MNERRVYIKEYTGNCPAKTFSATKSLIAEIRPQRILTQARLFSSNSAIST
jgi:hypothetical protein